MERPARPLPLVLTATTGVGDQSHVSGPTWCLIPRESRTARVARSDAGMPQSLRRSLTHSSQVNTQPLTGRTMRACSRGATTRALLAGAGDRPAQLEKG